MSPSPHLANEEAGAFRVSSQKRCEYLLELLRMVSFEALAIDGLAMQAYIGACQCEIVLCSTCARTGCACHGRCTQAHAKHSGSVQKT